MMSFLRKHLATAVVAAVTAMVAGGGGAAIAHGVHAKFAHNADKVDRHHANAISRVAFARADNDALVGPATEGTVLSTTITAPKKGFLQIVASSDIFGGTGAAVCWIEIGGATLTSTERVMDLDNATNSEEDCSTNGVQAVKPGTYTVDLLGSLSGGLRFDEAAMSVLFVPFNATGGKPSNFTIVNPSRAPQRGN